MTFWYLATPYSKYPGGMASAYVDACKEAGLLIRAGVPVFCPIAHTHGVAIWADISPADHDIWLPADRPFMDAACGIIVCKMESWELSYGIMEEIKIFTAAGKPVIYMQPGFIPVFPNG